MEADGLNMLVIYVIYTKTGALLIINQNQNQNATFTPWH